MKPIELLLWTSVLTTTLGSAPAQQPKQEQQEKHEKKKSDNLTTRFFEDEVERLTKEVEGSWMLFDYTDPSDVAVEDDASGFATFHDGFATLILALDTFRTTFLGVRASLTLDSGAFRYRFDEQANLQLASVLSFTNQTEDGETEPEPPGDAREYLVHLEDGVLELRTTQGVVLSFRKVEAGEFPETAIRKLERRRGGTEQWEDEDEEQR